MTVGQNYCFHLGIDEPIEYEELIPLGATSQFYAQLFCMTLDDFPESLPL